VQLDFSQWPGDLPYIRILNLNQLNQHLLTHRTEACQLKAFTEATFPSHRMGCRPVSVSDYAT